jgi:hypothetical protein
VASGKAVGQRPPQPAVENREMKKGKREKITVRPRLYGANAQ